MDDRAPSGSEGHPGKSLEAEIVYNDPVLWVSRIRAALHTRWLKRTYPFYSFGDGNSIHYSCELYRPSAGRISFGNRVYVAKDCWFNVVAPDESPVPSIIVSDGCKIGRRTTISCRNRIRLEEDVLFAPSVFLMDHAHQFSDINLPIHAQGLTEGGTIVIEKNCWIGYGATVLCGKGELRIGRNTVIGAHSIVRESVPPYSVVVGSPARVVRQFDPAKGEWMPRTASNA